MAKDTRAVAHVGHPHQRQGSLDAYKKGSLNAVKVFTQSGYTGSSDRPDALIAAMLLIIGHLYENRQDVGQHRTYETPLASRYLMDPYRLKSFA